MLTVVGGKVVYAAGDFEKLGPAKVPVLPDWSPVVKVPGHWRPTSPIQAQVHHCSGPCGVHAHSHDRARLSNAPVSDLPASGAPSAARVSRSDDCPRCAEFPFGAARNAHPTRSFT